MGAMGRDGAQPRLLWGHLDQAGSGSLAAPKMSVGPSPLKPPPREVWAPPPRWGVGQSWRGRPRCLADPVRGWPCWDLNCPCTACGGVWGAQCLNSLMTALGRCPRPTPARPRPPVTSPGRKRWGWRHGVAAKSLPCPETKRDRLLLGTSMGSCERA